MRGQINRRIYSTRTLDGRIRRRDRWPSQSTSSPHVPLYGCAALTLDHQIDGISLFRILLENFDHSKQNFLE
jgi:hypothetical protein